MAENKKAPVKAESPVEKTEEKAPVKAEVSVEKAEEKAISGDFIMTVGHLAWGQNGRNHFFADKKPLINAKVMNKYSETLKIWLAKGWIKKGSYK